VLLGARTKSGRHHSLTSREHGAAASSENGTQTVAKGDQGRPAGTDANLSEALRRLEGTLAEARENQQRHRRLTREEPKSLEHGLEPPREWRKNRLRTELRRQRKNSVANKLLPRKSFSDSKIHQTKGRSEHRKSLGTPAAWTMPMGAGESSVRVSSAQKFESLAQMKIGASRKITSRIEEARLNKRHSADRCSSRRKS
jgi:hypothetical protein